jgi:DNA-binding NtrC family response regulator
MTIDNPILIFLIDDDELYLKNLAINFANNSEYEVLTFVTGEQCIDNISKKPNIIVLDYYLNSIDKNAKNGIETLDIIKLKYPNMPVIMLSSQDNIDVAVDCMKHKAFDYVVKSETAFLRLQKAISSILDHQNIEKTLNWYMEKM